MRYMPLACAQCSRPMPSKSADAAKTHQLIVHERRGVLLTGYMYLAKPRYRGFRQIAFSYRSPDFGASLGQVRDSTVYLNKISTQDRTHFDYCMRFSSQSRFSVNISEGTNNRSGPHIHTASTRSEGPPSPSSLRPTFRRGRFCPTAACDMYSSWQIRSCQLAHGRICTTVRAVA